MTELTTLNDLCFMWALADGKANLKVKVGEMSLNSYWWKNVWTKWVHTVEKIYEQQ